MELRAPLELPELLPPGWAQLCLPLDRGMVPAGPVPVGADGDADGEDETAEDDVVEVVEVVAVDAEPPVDASATPVAPAPTPAATMPVTINRRPRPPIVEFIWFLPS